MRREQPTRFKASMLVCNEGSGTLLQQSPPKPGIVHRVKLDSSPDKPKDSFSNFSPITLVLMQHCDKTGTRATSSGSGMRRDSAGCEKGLLPGVPERGCCSYIRMTRTIQESLQRRPWHYDPSALDTTIAKALSTFIRPTS